MGRVARRAADRAPPPAAAAGLRAWEPAERAESVSSSATPGCAATASGIRSREAAPSGGRGSGLGSRPARGPGPRSPGGAPLRRRPARPPRYCRAPYPGRASRRPLSSCLGPGWGRRKPRRRAAEREGRAGRGAAAFLINRRARVRMGPAGSAGCGS